MTKPRIEFWYDFASTYSYLSALRIDARASEAGVAVVWRPFLLGPMFQAQGWDTSPFNIYPAKGRYMVRDITRIAAARGRTFRMPGTFPANSLTAARVALCGEGDGWIAPFTRATYAAEFEDRADIATAATLHSILTSLDLDGASILERARSSAIKERLRDQTSGAQTLGIFGAPTFVTSDGELFWGDDRLEQALDWAVKS